MRKSIKSLFPSFLQTIYSETKYYLRFKFYPKGIASELFKGILGYEINWENPQDINEKINWMKFNYDTSIWTNLADKYKVREYVALRVGEEILTKLYGVWKNANDIDFDKLPNKFVLKTNQGAGTVLPITDKTQINIKETKKIMNQWVKMVFGYKTVEPHYMKIKPLITAEEYIENDVSFSSSLVDYKVFCFSGKPYCILVCFNRVLGKHTNLSFYDCNWEPIPDILDGRHKGESIDIPKPKCLETLLCYATKLSLGHPQVRVDFYISNNKIYFGEMTFTSQGGYMDYISKKYSLEMGSLIKIHN